MIWYLVHPDLHSQKGCADQDVLSTKSKCRFLLNHEQHYKEVFTATDQYKRFRVIPEYVPLQHCQLRMYLLVLAISKLSQVCTSMYLVRTGT